MQEKFTNMRMIADKHSINLINMNIISIRGDAGLDGETLLNDIGVEDYKSVGIGVDLNSKILKGKYGPIIYLNNVGKLEDISTEDGKTTYFEKLVKDIEKYCAPKVPKLVAASTMKNTELNSSENDALALMQSALKTSVSDESKKEVSKKEVSKKEVDMPSKDEMLKLLESEMEDYQMIMIGTIYDTYKGISKASILKLVKSVVKDTWNFDESNQMILPQDD